IKPGNIMVCSDTNRVKLLDFGLAIQGEQELENFEGTCRYCSPERFKEGFKPTVTSDIYALGLVLYRVLTNRDAVTGKKVQEILKKVTSGKNDIFYKNGEVNETLRKIIAKCTEFEASKRYQDATELHLDLVCHISELNQTEDLPYLYLLDQRRSRILFPIPKRKYYIGRAFGNDLIIQDDTISRVHAVLTQEEQGVSLTNVSKTSSIKRNQDEISYQESHPLLQNDFIKISNYIFFYVPRKNSGTDSNGNPQDPATSTLSLEKTQMLLMAKEQDVYQMIKAGELKAVRVGSTLSIDTNSLYAHIERKSGHRMSLSTQEESPSDVQLEKIKLTLYENEEVIQFFEFPPDKETIVLGQNPDTDIHIDDLGISRRHCQVEKKGGNQYILKDLNSNNGTFIYGEQIKEYDLS
ncbi:MAG: FHA domain-containing protein, partial [Simkania sp.]|nr:FHA domain-containing protein [Simkania sp.]